MRRSYHKDRISPSFFRFAAQKLSKEFPERVVFVQLEYLEDYLYRQKYKHSLVIAGDSDLGCSRRCYEVMKSRRGTHFFVQNLSFPETPNVRLLPIGFEDPKWARSGMDWNLSPATRHSPKSNAVLVGPFRNTDPSRQELMRIQTSSSVFVQAKPMAAFHYANYATQFRYVACPRGNGMDTHRLWETIKRGSIPVVVDSYWARTVAKYIPVAMIPRWSEIELQQLALNSESPVSLREPEFLRTDWWISTFRKVLSSSTSTDSIPNQEAD